MNIFSPKFREFFFFPSRQVPSKYIRFIMSGVVSSEIQEAEVIQKIFSKSIDFLLNGKRLVMIGTLLQVFLAFCWLAHNPSGLSKVGVKLVAPPCCWKSGPYTKGFIQVQAPPTRALMLVLLPRAISLPVFKHKDNWQR